MSEEVVVGVGNPTIRDDGIGHRVVGELTDCPDLPGDVGLHRTSTSSFLALEALSGADRAVVVDAIDDGSDPGTVHRYRFQHGRFDGAVPDVLMHDLSFNEALQAGRNAYDVPSEVVVVGVQPASLAVGLELSDPVEAAVPQVVSAVLAELEAVDAETSEGAATEVEADELDATAHTTPTPE